MDWGENIETSLKREAFEEIGLKDFLYQAVAIYKWESSIESELVHSYITYDDNELSINTEELDDGNFFSIATIEKNLRRQIFTPNFEAEFKLIKAISHPEIKKSKYYNVMEI